MAGDWIKMRTNLDTDPKVIEMATSLEVSEMEIIGCLWKVWSWADSHSIDGNAIRVTCVTLDRFTGLTGFAEALRNVGWLEGRDNALTFPRFAEHNGQTAKKRAETNERVRKHRNAKTVTSVTQKALPEKRREEKNKPPPPTPLESPPRNINQEKAAAVDLLFSLGVEQAKVCVERAFANGATWEAIRAIADHFRKNPGAWGPPGLYSRVHNFDKSIPPDRGWAQPSVAHQQTKKSEKNSQKQAEYAAQEREKAKRGQKVIKENESLYGPQMDAWSDADLRDFIRQYDTGGMLQKQLKDRGREDAILRQVVLTKIKDHGPEIAKEKQEV